MTEVTVSYPLAFLAGLVSFLSPCVLPVVPSYIAFVSGMTLEELKAGDREDARRAAVLHAVLFAVGFGVVFMTLGLAATTVGQTVNRSLPWVSRAGGILLVLFGLYLVGVLKLPALARELRVHLKDRPAGALGSVAVGVAFGAGWTPCVGPILASILLWAGLEATQLQGMTLLGAYAVGLGVPFVGAALAFNWFLAGMDRVRSWLRPLEVGAGALLVVIGASMVTGHFALVSQVLADMGQLITLGTGR